jgi:small subunit ribosomal protein S8
MQQDPLADALCTIKNAERVSKKECVVPASNLIKNVLKVMQTHDYIGAFQLLERKRKEGPKFKVELRGKIMDTNVIRPRFSIKLAEFEKWEKRFLPAREFGILILTTPRGVVDHKRAKELGTGGKLLCYVY